MSIFSRFFTKNKNIESINEIKKTKSCTLFENNCRHGNYNHQLYFDCCKKFVDCSLCHKEKCDFYQRNTPVLKKIRCIQCGSTQSSCNKCQNSDCRVQFADNFCRLCCNWTSNENKSYHCYKCKKCYINSKGKLLHCDKCNTCFYEGQINTHHCNINLTDNECQICMIKVKNSPSKVYLLNCGHSIHHSCYLDYEKSCNEQKKIITCCLCRKSMFYNKEIEKKFDNYAKEWSVSSTQKEWLSYISCNDCGNKSITSYHPKYKKCIECSSYNNIELNIIKDIPVCEEVLQPSAPLLEK